MTPDICYQTQIAKLLRSSTNHWCNKDYRSAEIDCRLALELANTHLGKDTQTYGLCLTDLGIVLAAQGSVNSASDVLVEALEVLEKILGSHHPEVTMIFSRLHDLYEYR